MQSFFAQTCYSILGVIAPSYLGLDGDSVTAFYASFQGSYSYQMLGDDCKMTSLNFP